jgi:hypothetical protein
MSPSQLRNYGTVLLWAGVLVWVPYFMLRFIGESPSLMMFLPFHLLGVIGGARMRSAANKKLGKPVDKRKGYRRIAHLILIASLLVWVPYYALKLTGRPVELNPYLTIHLIGIFSGTGLMGIGSAVKYFKQKRQQ